MFHTIVEVSYDNYELDTDRWVLLSELVIRFMNGYGGQAYSEPGMRQGHGESLPRGPRARTARVLYNLLRQTMFSTGFASRSMAYGTLHEGTALRQYKKAVEEETGLGVRESGLWVNPAYLGCGASPDGLVYDQNTLVGVVDIKCPAVLEK